ncbi:sugar transporter ERD6-like 6 [Dendroctonus ponderosae]|uniref:sugar transporter ERD6-like 6 n=1 Tax=Dendroctonus ponderosae TaxID=77166 RepID=UPI0020350EDE|nr:sugar transporter ERD6-like 6 [Dendroctonus ponderosae]KAH1024986.1 hypothetical protein HUJ05_009805 [Dendroctonus ponderosae]KAH1024987.1 hypothetical protein HUJ05_009805 [Dendroctonus ponderosae]
MNKPLHNRQENYYENQNGEKEVTYTFDAPEEKVENLMATHIRTGAWQILPSACASLTCIPFGLMLGWPSSNYQILLSADSPIKITMDQSAMIAGFLLFGVSFGTMFSSKQLGLGPKYGIIFGNICILLGWIIMWRAQDIYGLLVSRIMIGAGHGYAMGQIKNYILEMTEAPLSEYLIKLVNFYGFSGFVLAYVVGPFVDFTQYSLISLIVSAFVLSAQFLLPLTPKELIRSQKIEDAKKLLSFLKPDINPEEESRKLIQNISEEPIQNGILRIMKDKTLRINFLKLTVLLICQQYCGAPPTLVYTQIIFSKSNVPYPEMISLGYAVLFFISIVIGTFVSPRYNKKALLLISSCSVLILYMCKIIVIYFKMNDNYFRYTSVIVMYLFIIFHTIGLASIPFTLINDWFPKSYRSFVTKYFIILFSLLALTNTKIFQVLITQYEFYVPFCFFTCINIFSVIFISIFIPSKTAPLIEENRYSANITITSIQITNKK